MQLFPGVQARMGSWEYYIVRMSMREIAENIKFADEIYGATQLSEVIQRQLRKRRATTDIAQYLAGQQDRFFSSIVIAALEGNPQWWPVRIEDDPQFTILRADRRLNSAFGVLIFDGTQDYYALDGQHRLAAIRSLIGGEPSDLTTQHVAPAEFRDEEVSVIIVVPRENESKDQFLIRYRRLFGNLNRHARPTTAFDNIVIDEDDP